MKVHPWVLGLGLAAIALAGFALSLKGPASARGLTATNAAPAAALAGAIASPPRRVLVIGGTSGIGLETVKLALARGHVVTSMARHLPSAPLSHPRLRFVQGSIDDARVVDDAVRDQDVIVVSIGVAPTRNPTTVFSTGINHVIAAMQAGGGGARLLVVTGIGAGDSRGHGGFGHDAVLLPLLLDTVYADKDLAEAAIYASATSWTIVRPGFLVDAPPTARYAVVGALEGVRAGSIARADVAHYLVGTAERGTDLRRTVLLTR